MYDTPENMLLLHFGGNSKSNSVYYQQEDILKDNSASQHRKGFRIS